MNYLKNLEKICNINSFSKNKQGVDKVAYCMQSWLEELNFETKTYSRKNIGNHQLFKSKQLPGTKILLLGHNDTVSFPNNFNSFSSDDTWVYGPGISDMKGGNIVALHALKNIYKKNNSIYNIDFLLLGDKQSKNNDSKDITLQIAKDYNYCFVFQSSGQNNELITSRKGISEYTITISTNISTSNSVDTNANLEASYKLQRLAKLSYLSKGTTCNIKTIQDKVMQNCKMVLELSYKTNKQKDILLDRLNSIVNTSYVQGTTSTLDKLNQRDIMQESQGQLDLLKKLEDITNLDIKKGHEDEVSDANYLSSSNIITLDGFGPLAQYNNTSNERVLKSSFEQRIKLMTDILSFHQEHNKF